MQKPLKMTSIVLKKNCSGFLCFKWVISCETAVGKEIKYDYAYLCLFCFHRKPIFFFFLEHKLLWNALYFWCLLKGFTKKNPIHKWNATCLCIHIITLCFFWGQVTELGQAACKVIPCTDKSTLSLYIWSFSGFFWWFRFLFVLNLKLSIWK